MSVTLAGAGQHVARVAPVGLVRSDEAVAWIAFALAGNREIHGDEERLVAGVVRSAHELLAKRAVAHHIELEPAPALRYLGRDALDRGGRGGGKGVGDTDRLRGAREHEVGARPPCANPAGGRDGHRQLHFAAEQRDPGVHLRHVDEDLGQKANPLEGRAVLPQGDLVLRAAVEKVEDGARQAPLGEAPQVFDAHRMVEVGHNSGLTVPSKAPQ
jgi:hypothetical protein